MQEANLIIVSVFTVLAVAVACSKKGGADAQTPEGPQNYVEVADVAKVPSFESTGEIPSCQHQAPHDPNLGFDRSLNVGDTTYVTVHLSNQNGSRHLQQSYGVKSIQDFKTRIIKTTQSMSSPEAGGEILTSDIQEFETCVFVNGDISCQSEDKLVDDLRSHMTNQGFDYLKSHPAGKAANCLIQVPSKPTETKTEAGHLHLQKGQSIEAILETETVYGPVFCGNQLIGEGEVITYTVTSPNVKSIPSIGELKGDHQACGGTKVIASHTTLVGGKVIESHRFDQVQPALR